MLEAEIVELTPEQQEEILAFQQAFLVAGEKNNLSDRVLLAVVGQLMGDLMAFHAKAGCCDPNELFAILALNVKQGFLDGMNGATGPTLN